ncbi:hypothetical protein [Methanosarcina spherical virus]|nr:ORF17 [Methanosarcina spherical virus]WKN02311.1 hypothetical protein HCCKFEEG_00017 [Methanosarcina spherical virus]WKN02331.1 hypothetical protein OBGAJBEG_00015 [Methanosarcina spherical virus]WKN02353.1 hypothetical protein FJIADALF_00017 [Methanosarcina spherical virus]
MFEEALFEPFLNSSFSIVVCIYLLYERSKFNEKIAVCLESVSLTLKDIKDDLKNK